MTIRYATTEILLSRHAKVYARRRAAVRWQHQGDPEEDIWRFSHQSHHPSSPVAIELQEFACGGARWDSGELLWLIFSNRRESCRQDLSDVVDARMPQSLSRDRSSRRLTVLRLRGTGPTSFPVECRAVGKRCMRADSSPRWSYDLVATCGPRME